MEAGGTRWVCSHCFLAKRSFWSCTERSLWEHPAAWAGKASWDVKGGLGMEPRELAARAFPPPRHCKVFVLLLSLSHSFTSNETCWFSARWRGRNGPEITNWDGKTGLHPALPPKNEGKRGGWLPEACPQVRRGWWSVPGIPPPMPNWALAITASGKLLNVVKHRRGKKSYIKVINERKSALCQGSGSRGNLSVR